jgi:hypothetical protein
MAMRWNCAANSDGHRSALGLVLAAVLTIALAGCATPERLPPVPAAATTSVQPLGIPNGRFFPGTQDEEMMHEGQQMVERQRKHLGLTDPEAPLPPVNFLAISGGGADGAFGAGLLNGWTEAGTRPEFHLVTGVSTGALSAPFAFLGSDYDAKLREFYTTIDADDIYSERGIIAALFDDALSDTTPLWRLISTQVNDELLVAIAAEYEKGRLLLIGTTDLDAQRPVIWNIGAIAASGHPGALDLVRKILRASSAIPGAFPPVMIDVEVDGVAHQEMHVDGGAIAQLFLYPPSLNPNVLKRQRTAYLIRNARQDPEWANIERLTLDVAGRAISTMIHSSGTNDLLRVYFITQRDGVDYNLAYIGSDFEMRAEQEFDRAYMNALYDYGYQQARQGYPWRKEPPILAPPPGQ